MAGSRLAGAAIAVGVVAVALLTTGGPPLTPGLGLGELARNTWTSIALIAGGGLAAGWLLARGSDGLGGARAPVIAFTGLFALTAASVGWSVVGDLSWTVAVLTAGYLGAFVAAACVARLGGVGTPAVVGGIGAACVALSVWALLVKVFGWSLYGQSAYGRLLSPSGYWNTTGLVAGLGLPCVIWAGARRDGSVFARAAGAPAATLLITVVVLSFSRSAVLATIVGAIVVLPLLAGRLRGVATLAIGGAGAAVACAWALAQPAVVDDANTAHVSAAARIAGGHRLGVVLLVAILVVAVVGAAFVRLADRRPIGATGARRADRALTGALAALPVLAVIGLAASRRGLTGEVSHLWHSLTSDTAGGVGFGSNRLVAASNSRPRYWHQALSVGSHHWVAGTGAGTFGIAHLRYPSALLTLGQDVLHAHGYLFQTFADLGALGVVASVVLLFAWGRAGARTVRLGGVAGADRAGAGGLRPSDDGCAALVAVVVAFGISSTIDWTWFFPAAAVPALVAAGWVAGRVPVRDRPARVSEPRTIPDREAIPARAAGPGAILAATGIALLTLLLAVASWLPLHAEQANNAALTALSTGDGGGALASADTAVSADPFAILGLRTRAAVYSALGEPDAAHAQLVEATGRQPENPQPWCWLAQDDLAHHDWSAAVAPARRSVMLDVTNELNQQAVLRSALARRPLPGTSCIGGR